MERCRSVATNAYSIVIEIAEIYLAAAVTGLRGGEIELKSGTKIPLLFFGCGADEQVIRLGSLGAFRVSFPAHV